MGANTWWLAEFTTTPGNEYVIVGMWVASVIVRGFSIGVAGLCLRWLLTRQWRYAVWLIPLCWLGLEFTHKFNVPGPYPWLSVAYCLPPSLDPFSRPRTYGVSTASPRA